MLEGLEFVQSGDMIRGAQILRGASTDLGSAHDDLGAPWAQPARLVPGLAQNRNSTYDVLGRAADAAAAAAEILDRVDIDRLRVVEGQVDLSAFHLLEAPLIELEATVSELRMALFEARTEWLVAPLRSRFDTAEIRAEQVYRQAVGTAELARLGPALLGADGPRRYFVAFVNSAEARATGGLMGNWAEITIDGGQISKSNSGRTAELQRGVMDNAPVLLEAPDEFFERYGRWNINARGETVGPNSWVNTTISPHMPTVGSVYAQLYEGATGRAVDGVFMIDPAGLAALLAVAGPIEIPEVGITLDASNTEQFLVLDQYQFEEADREDLLEAVSEGTIDRVLNSTLPPPHEMARALSDAALEGHLSGFAVRGSEQEFFEFVGIDAAIPAFGSDTLSDVLAVTAINSSGNKIDSFLERDIEYRPVHDPVTGRVDSTLRLTLRNTAPTTGFPDYVIGNILDLPIGTNQMMIEIFSPLEVDELLVDGETISVFRSDEHGLRVALIGVAVPPGGTMVVEATLSGRIAGGPYELIYRPQVLPRRDTLVVEARSGSVRFDHEGSWGRRSVLTAAGIRAWR